MFFDSRRRGRTFAALGFALLVAGRAAAEPPSRVLFIGNSLTYWNDLPLLVEAMAAAKGLSLTSEVVTRSGPLSHFSRHSAVLSGPVKPFEKDTLT